MPAMADPLMLVQTGEGSALARESDLEGMDQPARQFPLVWLETSALAWRITDSPFPSPLITTGNPADAVPGAIGQSGTRLVFGGTGLDYGRTAGMRVTAGAWLDDEPYGIELSAFALRKAGTYFSVRSDADGSPPIYMPAFLVAAGGEGARVVADPVQGFAGGVAVLTEARLNSWEVNGLVALDRSNEAAVDLLVGFRSMSLEETLTIRNQSADLTLGTFTDVMDRFHTYNVFKGAQIGLRSSGYSGNWFASLTGKLAFGSTSTRLTVNGITSQAAAPPLVNGIFPSGFLAQPSNTLEQTHDEWSCISEINLRAGCDAWGCLRVFVGFDFLYWNTVARPGDQIDRAINLTQSQVFGGGVLVGQRRPAPIYQTSDFIAQGISAGIELRY